MFFKRKKKRNNKVSTQEHISVGEKEKIEIESYEDLGTAIKHSKKYVSHIIVSKTGEIDPKWVKYVDTVDIAVSACVSHIFEKVPFHLPEKIKLEIKEDAIAIFRQSSRISGLKRSAEIAVQSAVVSAFHYHQKSSL